MCAFCVGLILVFQQHFSCISTPYLYSTQKDLGCTYDSRMFQVSVFLLKALLVCSDKLIQKHGKLLWNLHFDLSDAHNRKVPV